MVQNLQYLTTVILLPVAAYLLAFLCYKVLSRYAIVHKIRIPINISLLLATLHLIVKLTARPGSTVPEFISQLLLFLLYFCLFYGLVRILESLLVEDVLLKNHRVNIPVFFRDVLRFFLLVIAVTVLLKIVFGVEPSAFIVTSTVMSAVIGLALQDMLANIIAGIALQMERSFGIGDWVRITDREGEVVEMNWRSTKIKTRDNDFLILPNTSVASTEILNYYEPSRIHMIRLVIGASYEAPPNKVKAALKQIAADTAAVLDQPPATIYVLNYNDFSVDYEIRCWIGDYEHAPNIKDRIMTKIWYQFRRDGIAIPFPIRDVRMEQVDAARNDQVKLQQKMLEDTVTSMRHINILQPFTEPKLLELAHMARYQVFARGELLVRQGDQDSTFFIIKSGKVEVFAQLDNGLRTELGEFGRDFYFGEIALLTGEPRTATVRAKMDTEALIIDKDSFAVLLKENPSMAITLSDILKQRSAELKKAQESHSGMNTSKKKPGNESHNFLGRIQRFFNLD